EVIVCATARRAPSPKAARGGGQLRVFQGEPLHPLLAEVDLQARVAAGAFGIDDDALAELRVQDRLADAESMAGRFGPAALCRLGRPRHVVEPALPRPGGQPLDYFPRESSRAAAGE